MRIAFLGTPDFAVPSLQMLIDSGHDLAVFTQPDRPYGRHAKLTPTPIKTLALRHGIPVYQFSRIRDEAGVIALQDFGPELMVTAAFGQILSKENLDIPRLGCVNVHGSLLPKYRGAAPIQWAVMDGEEVTGITTMLTDVGLDTGDMLLKAETPIGPNETAGELYYRLSVLGAALLKDTIKGLAAGTIVPVPQNEAQATKCRMLKKEDGKIHWSWTAKRVHDRVRGANPWPGAYASLPDGGTLKLWLTRLAGPGEGIPGTCFGEANTGLFISCGDGNSVEVLELQAPGGKRMEAKAFLRGKSLSGVTLT